MRSYKFHTNRKKYKNNYYVKLINIIFQIIFVSLLEIIITNYVKIKDLVLVYFLTIYFTKCKPSRL